MSLELHRRASLTPFTGTSFSSSTTPKRYADRFMRSNESDISRYGESTGGSVGSGVGVGVGVPVGAAVGIDVGFGVGDAVGAGVGV